MIVKNVNKYVYTINELSICNLLKQKYLVFDIEATGLNVKENYVTQFGCVPLVDMRMLLKEAFCSFVNSPKPIPRAIAKLTGISNKEIKKAPSFKTVITRIWKKYKDYMWIAQCGFEFDFPLLDNICKRYKISFFSPKRIDTKIMFAYLHPDLSETFSTDYLQNYYKIDSSDIKRHNALNDSILIARILQKILKGYQMQKIHDLIIQSPLTIKKFIPKPLK